ncbi:uncharacterized protein ACBR49_012903 [Aulostomus maculatus]
MSELFMECVEEELEPWQKQAPEVHLIEDDDDEPIFVGVLPNNQKDNKPTPTPLQKDSAGKQDVSCPAPQPAPIMLPLNITGNAVNTVAPSLTLAPQPVIVNNQGFIVTSPQLANSSDFIATLGSQYPPGTKFTIVPAGQQRLIQQVATGTVLPGVVHRPRVQQITNNVVTLSNVQSPAVYATKPNMLQVNRPTSLQTVSVPVMSNSNNTDQIILKRALPPPQDDSATKKTKLDLGQANVTDPVENGTFRKKCSRCQEEFFQPETLKCHMKTCCVSVESMVPSAMNIGGHKRIMLVSDFYYGRFDGDWNKRVGLKTNTTFKCQSCLKVLKNNIRFMNHMKHHLELEKQNSESWESHTTCQHCYRQYMTPFQLQCHIESAHSPIESSTNCKICELAFESEQVLLEHMKDNHKPGEMPYVCQVCNYRSSFFSDVEAHFRNVHENTKDLLCPFCLKVLRSSHMYMQHYMKHQRKGIHRCGKCRLNFLTYKEKVEHRTHVHKTFRKPRALEGLPPGTKVTIRASLTGKTTHLPSSPDRSGFIVSSDTLGLNQKSKPPASLSTKLNASGAGKAKTPQDKKDVSRTSKINLSLKHIRLGRGLYTCIECNTKVDDFFSHFPITSNCGACTYRTSCKVSIGNHMIRFHSTVNKSRFSKLDYKKRSSASKFTLVCLNCDLLVDASGGDLMSKHLTDRPNHLCKVIQEKADINAKDEVQPILGQPAKVVCILTSAPTRGPKESDLKVVDCVPSCTFPTVEQPGPAPMSAGGNQEKSVIESSSPGELKESSLPGSSSFCTLDGALEMADKSKGNSEILDVREEPPTSLTVSEQETAEQQQHGSAVNECAKTRRSQGNDSRRWMSHQQQRLLSQIQSQERHRQTEARRLDRERQLQQSLRDEERFEMKRHQRQIQEELQEREMEISLLKAEEERINREKQLEQEERIAKELARIKHEKQREEKMRQHIKENSAELRELESRLKSVYLNRERAAQIAEHEARKLEIMRQEAELSQKLERGHQQAEAQKQKQEQRRHEEMIQYQRDLEQQLVEREQKRQEAYEEFLKEKLMVDEIIRKIYEEDQRERQLKMEKVRAIQQNIEEFNRLQAEWRRLEEEKMEAENKRIMEFARHQQQMEESRKAKIREREEAKEHHRGILAKKFQEKEQQREEMEKIRQELHMEEQEEAIRQREIEEMEKKIRQRLLMQQTFQEQMAFKEMRRQAKKEEEETFRKISMAKFAEDDRIEQMNAQKRRMKQLEHKREVEKLIEDRRRQREADMELRAEEQAIEQEREALRRKIIEEERLRLLKLHATKLLGYLPQGLLREDDLGHFDEDFRKNFETRWEDSVSEQDEDKD